MSNNTLINKLRYIKQTVQDHRKKKYVSYLTALRNWYKFRNLEYEIYDLEEAGKFKTSDTVFILGAGPSLNKLNHEHIEIIKRHNSCGINYSFLKEEIVPTFHQISYENDWGLDYMVRALSKRKGLLKDTIFFLNSKTYYRMGHPRITPYFFSEKPKCCFYRLPKPISLECPRPFNNNDFDKTVYYRGTLTIVLELLLKLGYKNIILLGVDPDNLSYFFDDMDEMRDYCNRLYATYREKGINKYENMVPKGKKFNTIDTYLYALKNYLLKKRNVNLFVGFKNNMFYPKIPAYFD